jgi:hypothetical protein
VAASSTSPRCTSDWPMPGNTGYCLAKGGMRILTSTAGVELTRHNILVVGVGPGAVATPINLGTMNDQAKLAQLAAIRLGGAPRGLRAWSAFLPATARATSPRPRCSPTGHHASLRWPLVSWPHRLPLHATEKSRLTVACATDVLPPRLQSCPHREIMTMLVSRSNSFESNCLRARPTTVNRTVSNPACFRPACNH